MLSEDSRGAGRTTKAPGGWTPPPRGLSSLQGVLPARMGRGQWRCWAPRLPVLVIMASVEENLAGQQCPGSPGTFRLTTISLHLQHKSSPLFALNPPRLLPRASVRQCWQNPLCHCPDTYLLHVHVPFLPATSLSTRCQTLSLLVWPSTGFMDHLTSVSLRTSQPFL